MITLLFIMKKFIHYLINCEGVIEFDNNFEKNVESDFFFVIKI